MLDRWIRAQRIGLAAYRLERWRVNSENQGYSPRAITPKQIRDFLESELETACGRYRPFISTLPPSVLHHLVSIRQRALGPKLLQMHGSWIKAQKEQAGGTDSLGTSPVMLGQLFAHHIMYGSRTERSLVRLAKSMLSHRWNQYERHQPVLDAFAETLPILRSTIATTALKQAALDRLSKHLTAAPRWLDTENAILTRLYIWPLLVCRADGAVISLPVSLEVYFDRRSDLLITGDERVNTKAWNSSFAKSVTAAKNLWRAKHGHFGRRFREEIDSTSIEADFTVASQIVGDFPEDIRVTDDSAEAYFTQAILSRLLGQPVSTASIVTGGIGDPLDNLDYNFKWPGHAAEKVQYVFHSRLFEKVILRDINEHDRRRREVVELVQTHQQGVEINFVHTLQNVTDSFQVEGWRQFRYVRCPDLAWHLHSAGTLLPSGDNARVQTWLSLLRENDDSLLVAPEEVTPLDLAGALWHINVNLRNELDERPPMLSWAFIRAAEGEVDARFWHVIWGITGSSEMDFEKFCQSFTSLSAAERLAEALNSFGPTQRDRSRRAPDILVVLGAKYLSASLSTTRNPLLRRLTFKKIVSLLGDHKFLDPVPEPDLRRFVGSTRLIVFDDDWAEERVPQERPADLNVLEWERLNYLSIFRFGFTQQMAALLWDELRLEEIPVRKFLRKCVDLGQLRYSLSGEYYIPRRVEHTISKAKEVMARMHFAAAIAHAPYLSMSRVPAITFERALAPERVHEANYHLREARNLARGVDRQLQDAAHAAFQRLLRFAEYPGWGILRDLVGLGKETGSLDAYDLARDLIRGWENAEGPPHPVELVTAARATVNRWEDMKRHKGYDAQKVGGFQSEAEQLFNNALIACEHPAYQTEELYNRLYVISHHSLFTNKQISASALDERLSALEAQKREALQILNTPDANVDGTAIPGELYELWGDVIASHEEALALYYLGLRWQPAWQQLGIKFIGAAYLASGIKTSIAAFEGFLVFSNPKNGEPFMTLSKVEAEKIAFHATQNAARHSEPTAWGMERRSKGILQLRQILDRA